MKQRLTILLITLLSVIGIAIGLSFAWYTHYQKTGNIKVSSGGITMTYTINDDDEINVETYEIENVVFFDADCGSSYTLAKATGNYISGTKYYNVVAAQGNFDNSKIYYKESGNVYSLVDTTGFNQSTDVSNYYHISHASGTFVSNTTYYSLSNGVYSLVDTSNFDSSNIVAMYYLITPAETYSPSNIYYSLSGHSYDEVDISSFDDNTDVSSYHLINEVNTSGFNNNTDVSSYYVAKEKTYGEAKYLTKSAIIMELTINNANDVSAEVIVSGGQISANPYIYCFITDEEVNSFNENRMVNSYLKLNDLSNEFELTIESGESETLYIYIYGIQPNDLANNEFLNSHYSFVISIVATKVSS